MLDSQLPHDEASYQSNDESFAQDVEGTHREP